MRAFRFAPQLARGVFVNCSLDAMIVFVLLEWRFRHIGNNPFRSGT